MPADLAVPSDDPLTIPPEKLKNVTVLRTVLGGDIVYGVAWRRGSRPGG